jgi:hypothetical protein
MLAKVPEISLIEGVRAASKYAQQLEEMIPPMLSLVPDSDSPEHAANDS